MFVRKSSFLFLMLLALPIKLYGLEGTVLHDDIVYDLKESYMPDGSSKQCAPGDLSAQLKDGDASVDVCFPPVEGVDANTEYPDPEYCDEYNCGGGTHFGRRTQCKCRNGERIDLNVTQGFVDKASSIAPSNVTYVACCKKGEIALLIYDSDGVPTGTRCCPEFTTDYYNGRCLQRKDRFCHITHDGGRVCCPSSAPYWDYVVRECSSKKRKQCPDDRPIFDIVRKKCITKEEVKDNNRMLCDDKKLLCGPDEVCQKIDLEALEGVDFDTVLGQLSESLGGSGDIETEMYYCKKISNVDNRVSSSLSSSTSKKSSESVNTSEAMSAMSVPPVKSVKSHISSRDFVSQGWSLGRDR